MLQPRVALPVGAACVAVIAAGFPSVATPKHGHEALDDEESTDRPVSEVSAPSSAGAIEQLSVENVSDFVAVRARHTGPYWDGRTDFKLGADGQSSYPYRVSVTRGDADATLSRKGGDSWKCSDARASANDASTETLVVIPRSCFESSAERVRAKASAYGADGDKLSTAAKGNVSRTEKPNVVVIMSDDMRDDELDGPWMNKTRRWIGDAGVRFQNSFAPLPLCAPARASFLTGQYPHNHGVWSHKPPYGFSVFHDKETLPVWMRRGGYSTFMLGKYINGYGKKFMPAPNGKPSERYVPPGWDDWRASLDNGGTYNYRATHLNNNGRMQSLVGRYQTKAYGQIASNEVKRQVKSGNPYFMYLSFTAPHHGAPVEDDDPQAVIDLEDTKYRIKTPAVTGEQRGRWDGDIPLAPGAGSESDMTDKPRFMQRLPGMTASEQDGVRELARQRAEAEGTLDDSVARIMRRLRASDELDNTYVVFTSDNGYFLGEHRMRQGKTLPYEPSLRTPTLVRGPGIPAGQTRSDPFLSIDFAPTILRMAGMSTDQPLPIDGRPMLDVASEGDRGWTRPIITETGPTTVPTLMDLSGETVGNDPNDSSKATRIRGVRAPDFLFTETSGREPELYNLETDPGEVNSVLGDDRFDGVHDTLKEVLADLQACLGEECRTPLPRSLRESASGADLSGDGTPDDDEKSDEPGGGKPDGDKSGDGKPDGDKLDEGKPDGDKPDEGKPDGDKPDEGKPDGDKPGDGKPDGDKSGDGKSDDGKSDDESDGSKPRN